MDSSAISGQTAYLLCGCSHEGQVIYLLIFPGYFLPKPADDRSLRQ